MITTLIVVYIVISIIGLAIAAMEIEFLKDEIYQIQLNEHFGIDRDKDGIVFEGTKFEKKISKRWHNNFSSVIILSLDSFRR